MTVTLASIKAQLDTLVADVQEAITDIQNLNTQLAAAIAAEADPATLQAISDEISTATTNLTAVLPVSDTSTASVPGASSAGSAALPSTQE